MRYSKQSVEARLLQDDPEAIGQVIRWASSVMTWPRFWSLREEWPDLVQETLAQVVQSLQAGRFDPARDFRFYVQGIARHVAARALHQAVLRKAGSQHAPTVEAFACAQEPSPAAAAMARQIVRRVMDLASEECRLLIRLYFLEEKAYEEIGKELLLPVGTVKSRLSRCLGEVQKALRVVVPRHATEAKSHAPGRITATPRVIS